MKLGKTKLAFSTICLIAALSLAVFAVYAWFVTFEDVKTAGIDAGVTTDDVLKFEIHVYYLDNLFSDDDETFLGYNKSKNGNVSAGITEYLVDDKEDGELTSDDDSMRPYGAFNADFATAVLIEIDLEIRPNDNYYRIYASNDTPKVEVTKVKEEDDVFASHLSNVIGFDKAQGSNFDNRTDSGLFNKIESIGNFYNADGDKIPTKILQNNIRPLAQNGETANYKEKLYFIMDYIDEPFPQLSSMILEAGGTLTSELRFLGDITIGLETYDPNNETD